MDKADQPSVPQHQSINKTKRRLQQQRNKHVFLLPLPLQGHINPMFQLAELLQSHGRFSVTIIHTRFNAPEPTKHPGFRFVVLQEPVPTEHLTPTDNLMVFVRNLNDAVEVPLRDQLAKLMQEVRDEEGEAEPPPILGNSHPRCCLISDAVMFSAGLVAKQLGLPRIVLRTAGAACFNVFAAFPRLRELGYLPIQDYHGNALIVEMPPYRVRDLPAAFKYSSQEEVYEVIANMVNHTRSAKALILNSFDALEPIDIPKVKEEFQVPIYSIGPLHKLSPGAQGSLLEQDATCIDWLNKQRDSSDLVLYVSFGSIASMDAEELRETAWGLANSQIPFLWVVRPDSVRGNSRNPVELLPADFWEETKMRGKVVEWAPQQDVLHHPAVGGFWTHCGWNSTLEAICEGVPMLCWPCFGDQMVNARLVTEVWKVGITLENGLQKDDILDAVRRLMVFEDGKEMRRRAKNLKAEADRCIINQEGAGSALKNLDALINSIESL